MAATIEPGTSSKEAQDLQKRLVKFGYSVPTDGSMDDRTMKAVNDLSGRIGYNSSLKTVDAGFLKALAAFEKKKFHKIKLCGTLYVVDDEELEKLKKAFAPHAEKSIQPYVSMAEEVQSLWKAHDDTRSDNWFWSTVIEKAAGISFPPKSVADGALKSAENLKSAARNLRLTKSLYATETNNIRKAFATIDQYRDELFIGAEGLVVQLQAIEQSCVVTLEISAALATGGASVQAQIALSMAVAGYAQALKEVETASVQANYKVIDGLGRIAFSAGIDGVCNMILKGPKGKAVLDGIEKAALKEASPMLKTYIVKGIRGGGEKMIEDGIKGLGSLLTDPSKKLTLEEVIKAAVASFVTGMSVGILDKTAAKWGKSASKNFYAKDFEVFGKNVELDKAGEEAIKKTIEKVAGGIAESVISNWDPKKDANKAYDAIKAAVLGDSRVKATAKKYAKKK
ncbi:peptidoglycan-binding domain-containing protein [Seohaeicola zhoushanensis]|uniref:Uncharacterized protein n=1 Tax=Seohaeicola zhoushanensis TaxID=1569283 RepID=A0A8J3M8Y0_9RHOB|nr:hypothetical protein [Seohaeicola zhoushanensis]GHF57325.1 hypothetical protein GCM10017056_30960 [Seohaeicola zhoushanensis]